MSQANVQFSVASHMLAALGVHAGEPMRSHELAESVNADPSFVRRVLSKLARAGLVTTTRGKNGACMLARPPSQITLLDIYRASETPQPCAVHAYPVVDACRISRNIKGCMEEVLCQAQRGFEERLAAQSLADVLRRVKKGQ